MTDYKHILIPVDFSQACKQVIDRAISVADKYKASINMLHVVEYLPPLDFGYETVSTPSLYGVEEEIIKHASKNLEQLAAEYSIATANTSVVMGTPKTEIIRFANQHEIDLIVIGSHGRHGIQRLLGSTAYPVTHNADCDVLAIRIKD